MPWWKPATWKFGAVSNWFVLLDYMYWSATWKLGAVSSWFILLDYNMCCFSAPTQPCGLLYGNVLLKNEQKAVKETSKQRKCCSQAREQTLCRICRCRCQTCKWAGMRSSSPQNLPASASLLYIGSTVVKKTANKCIAYRQLQWKVQPVNITYNCSGQYSQ